METDVGAVNTPVENTALQAALLVSDVKAYYADQVDTTLPPINIINEFSIAFYTRLAKKDGGNLFISPLSIHMVLFLASFGATSNALEEIKKTMKQINDPAKYKRLLEKLGNKENLKFVSGMFVDSSFDIGTYFIENSNYYLFANIEKKNFKSDPDKERQEINNFVYEKTDFKIRELFPIDSINASTGTVLASAMYFKCAWAREFQSAKDKTMFWNSSGESVETNMMFLREDLNYYHDTNINFVALQLPFEDTDYSMILLLPDDRNGLEYLEDNILSRVKISHLLLDMKTHKRTVDLHLPSFKIERSMDVEETLTDLGCGTMFKEEATFANINSNGNLSVDKFMHISLIDIDEKGAGGGKSTGASNRSDGGQTNGSIDFIVDHPFLFFIISHIKDNDDIILFAGRIMELDSQSNENIPINFS